MLVVLATAVVAAETTLAFASGPVIWMQAGRADFLQGEPISTAITDAGELRLPPELDAVFDSDEPSIWSVVAASDGTVYVGAGDEGQVFRVSATGESDLFFDSGEVSAQALAWGPDDHLYVATGPRGAVYRLAPSYQHDSNAGTGTSPWFDPGAEYIWDLAFDRAGRLFVATGTEGKIFRVESNTSGGAGELFYDSTERHTTALAIDLDGSLIVGTEDGGQVYRLDESGDVFVLFDSPFAEITSLAVADVGVYVGAFGGSAAAAGGGSQAASVPAASGAPPAGVTSSTRVSIAARASASTSGDASGAAGAVFLVHRDGYVEELLSSDSDGIYALFAGVDSVVAGTGPDGRILRVTAGGEMSLLGKIDAEQIVAFAASGVDTTYVATSNLGRLYRMTPQFRANGEYLSQVKDTGATSRWGTLRWRATEPPGTALNISTRSGNTDTPNDTWSDWSAAYETATGSVITSPPARYVQWRARLTTDDPRLTPTLHRVDLVYVPRNRGPQIDELRVHPAGVVYRVTNVDDGLPFAQVPAVVERELRESGGAGGGNGANTFLGRPLYVSGRRSFSWKASDADGDDLSYSLAFRGEGEATWKPLEEKLSETLYTLETNRLPDGMYVVRLTVTDQASNPEDEARHANVSSAAFMIDNTPPTVTELTATAVLTTAIHYEIRGVASDGTSLIRKLEYSVDGAPWRTVVPADGVADAGREEIRFDVAAVSAGEHVIVVRAVDTALNHGAGKVVFAVE